MHIVVYVRPEESADTQSGDRRPTAVPHELSEITNRFGVNVQPMPPAEHDPSAERQFTIEVPDLPTAERMLQEIRKAGRVQTAYVKPAEELP
jgi:hypothetical protein